MKKFNQRSRGYHFGPVYVYYNSDYKLFQISWNRGSVHVPSIARAMVKNFALDESWYYYLIGALALGRIVYKGDQKVVYVDSSPSAWSAWQARLLGRFITRERFS